MKVFWLNWLLVLGAICWFASSIVLLVGYNKVTSFDESYYAGACIVRQVYILNANKTAVAFLDYLDPPRNFEMKQNVTILHNFDPRNTQKYMKLYYPVGSYVGCLVSPKGLSIQLEDDGAYFVSAIILYIVCALSLAFYAILQYFIYRRRLTYREFEDDDPADLTLYQNSTLMVPGLSQIKHDFSYAQKMLWSNQEKIEPSRFQELVDLQLKAIVTLAEGQEKEKFMREVYKTLKPL